MLIVDFMQFAALTELHEKRMTGLFGQPGLILLHRT